MGFRRDISDRIIRLHHHSEVLSDNPLGDPAARTLLVLLPEVYEAEPERRYPVIWVLAPFTSWGARLLNLQAWDENVAQRAVRLMGSGQMPPVLLVFPDFFTRYGGSQYLNSTAVGHYEDYLINELVPYLDDHVRTIPDRDCRALLGYSSGGYGALVHGMRHSDIFGAVAAHSGDLFFDTCYRPDIPAAVRALESFGGLGAFLSSLDSTERIERGSAWYAALNLVAMSACYSPNPDSPFGFDLPFDTYTGEIIPSIWERWLALDPISMTELHARELHTLNALFFDCGNADEFNLFLGARLLHRKLESLGIPHTYEEFDGGHRNINWRFDTSLRLLGKALADQTG